MYARRNLFRRMCHNAGRISGTGNRSSLTAKLYKNKEKRQVAEMLSALFLYKKA